MKVDEIAQQLVRALRGRRPQRSLSRKLGFTTNVVYAWERGRSAPKASQFLQLAEHCGVDTRSALSGFYRTAPAFLRSERAFPSVAAVAPLLRSIKGSATIVSLSERTGLNRFALSNWLRGKAEPRLPELLLVIHHATFRLPDWVAQFENPLKLPALRTAWQQQLAARAAAYRLPWSQAVLRALELRDYQSQDHQPGWLSQRLALPAGTEEEALELLNSSGQIRWNGSRWAVVFEGAVNLRQNPEAARHQRAFWVSVAAERAVSGKGMFAYNVCSVSLEDLERLKQMQREFLQAARTIIAQSKPECVALLQAQLLPLDAVKESGSG